MTDYTLLQKVQLKPSLHQPTGKTKHFHGNQECPLPHELRIIQYHGNKGFYLFYCDLHGIEFTDTYHEILEDALDQAEWEFNVKPNEWNK
jgi:hypothetical protein